MSSFEAMLQAPGAIVECDDDPEAVYELLCAKGWSDGLPVIPPTPQRVERMLAYCDRDFDRARREDPAALRRGDAHTARFQRRDGGLQARVLPARLLRSRRWPRNPTTSTAPRRPRTRARRC